MGHIGLALSGQLESMDDYVRSAQYAEELGYDWISLDENYFLRDSLTTATAVATATDSLTVGWLVNPYSRHPVVTALSAASLDECTGGDTVVIMAAGFPPLMEPFVEYEEPLWTTKHAIDLIRELLGEESVHFSEGPFDVEGVRTGECPVLKFMGDFDYPREDIPIYVAAMGPQMLKMAGDVGDGLYLGVGCAPPMVADAVERAEEGLALSGRTREDYDVAGLVFGARSLSGPARRFAAHNVGAWQPMEVIEMTTIDDENALAVREAYADGGAEAAIDHVTDRMVETFVVTPENDIPPGERLDMYVEAGLDVPVLMPIDGTCVESVTEMGAEWSQSG